MQCGSTEKLQFDHVDWRTKEFTIAPNWAMKDRIAFEAELAKCQLLCTECHDAKTKLDKSEMEPPEFAHGTTYAWMKRKCECVPCGSAKRAWNDARNAKRRNNGGRGTYKLPAEHGTIKRYRRGCKCSDCKAANVRSAQEYKAVKELREAAKEQI